MDEKGIKQQLRQAKIGYDAAMAAIPYMPKDARPYTRLTAENYMREITRLERICKQLTGK